MSERWISNARNPRVPLRLRSRDAIENVVRYVGATILIGWVISASGQPALGVVAAIVVLGSYACIDRVRDRRTVFPERQLIALMTVYQIGHAIWW